MLRERGEAVKVSHLWVLVQFGIGHVLLLILLFTNMEPRRVRVPYLSEAASFTFPIMDVPFR